MERLAAALAPALADAAPVDEMLALPLTDGEPDGEGDPLTVSVAARDALALDDAHADSDKVAASAGVDDPRADCETDAEGSGVDDARTDCETDAEGASVADARADCETDAEGASVADARVDCETDAEGASVTDARADCETDAETDALGVKDVASPAARNACASSSAARTARICGGRIAAGSQGARVTTALHVTMIARRPRSSR
jgi:hypothetical protein